MKMVVLLATALAFGAGAVAAYVVPWFCCKPPDDADEDREATGIHEGTDPGTHSRSVIEDNPAHPTNIRINGCNRVRVTMVPPTLESTDINSTVSTSTTENSATLNTYHQENPVIESTRHPVEVLSVKIGLESLGDTDQMTSEVTNSESIQLDGSNADSSRKSENAEAFLSKSEDTRPSESEFENSGNTDSGLTNSCTLAVGLLIKNEENAFATLPSSETSNPTDESSTETTNRTSSATSGISHHRSIQTDDTASESKAMLSLAAVSTDPESSAATSSTKAEESFSTAPTTFDPSNSTDGSFTDTINIRTSTSRESETFSSGPTRLLTHAVVESSKISDYLETIPEVSTSPTLSSQPSPTVPQQLDYGLPRVNRTPNVTASNAGSITSTSMRVSNRMALHSALSNRTPSIRGSPDSTRSASSKCQNAKFRKPSRTTRYALALFRRFKTMRRGIRIETTPRSVRNKNNQTLSVRSLSVEKELPAGHSTLISEEQRLFESIRRRKSPKTLKPYTLNTFSLPGTFEDPGISSNHDLYFIPQSDIEVDEEPLDSSSRSHSECSNENAGDMSTRRNSLSHSAESCREVLREVAEYLKFRTSSKSSERGVSLSEFLTFCGEVSKTCMEDENQNVRSDSSSSGNVNVEETGSDTRDSEAGRLESGCLPKSNGLPRRIKKIFHIGSKDRRKCNKIMSPLRKGQVSNSAPVEFQCNSAGTSSQLKSELNPMVVGTPVSSTDISSYFELGLAPPDDQRDLDAPRADLQSKTERCTRDLETGRLEGDCLIKSNGLPCRIKNVLHIASKNRSKDNKILSSIRKGHVLNGAPVEFQRNSAGTS